MEKREVRRHVENPQKPSREKSHAAMLEEALARPGIHEVMHVYQRWQKLDRGLDPYRATKRRPHTVTTTDHANVSQ